MSNSTPTTETLKQFSLIGLGCLTWLAIPAAVIGIIGLIKIVF